ncbi:MAG: hypothetical protein Q9177_004794 [Variospora cf. flavescens]
MSSSKVPPTPNWRTHPLAQKVLKSITKGGPSPSATGGQNVHSTPVNAVYYPNWKVYSQSPPSSLNLNHTTHIYYAFAFLKPDGTLYLSDEHADTQIAVDGTHGCLNSLRNLKRQYPNLKTLLSVGGGGKGSEPFASMASSSSARENFANSAKQMLDTYDFDGLDIDWEHPDNPKKGSDYTSLMSTLRKHLAAPKYILTSALPAGTWALQYIDLAKAASHMDYVNIMSYDFAGPWGNMSGYHSQLYTPPNSSAEMQTSGQSAVQYLRSKGVPASKITLGIPVYGRSFLEASHINQRFKSSGGNEGTFEYSQLPRPGTQELVDQRAGAAYCVGGDGGFVAYDNPDTVQVKAHFAKQHKLAGLFYWTGPGDSKGPRSLVSAGYNALNSA